jgi:hypothetical protein
VDTATPEPDGLKRRFAELLGVVRLTEGSRFSAENRLAAHDRVSVWALSLISVALMVVPLLQAMNVTVGLGAAALNALQVAFAVLVLVFSLLISKDNFAVRSERMHRCGMELSDLGRVVDASLSRGATESDYESVCERYQSILLGYENHTEVDFLYFRTSRRSEYYREKTGTWLWDVARSRIRAWLAYLPYVVLCMLVGVAFWLMMRGDRSDVTVPEGPANKQMQLTTGSAVRSTPVPSGTVIGHSGRQLAALPFATDL